MTSQGFRRAVALAAASLFVIAAAGCGSSSVSANAATITELGGGADDVHINRADFEDELQMLVENDDFRSLLSSNEIDANDESVDARVAASWLSQRITQVAIDAEYEARDAKVTEENRKQGEQQVIAQFGGDQVGTKIVDSLPESFRKDLIEGAARGFAVLDSYAQEPTDAEVRAFYKDNADQFACESGKEVAHILVKDEAQANDLMTQLRAGADFSDLATQFSTDTGSAQQGGSLGCLKSGTFVPEFQQAADAAALGTPVGPVKSEFGYHVILVTEFENSIEDVRPQIVQALQQQGGQKAQDAILGRIDRMKVKVDPRYGTWGEVDDGQGGKRKQVIPPKSVDVRDGRDPETTTTGPSDQGSP